MSIADVYKGRKICNVDFIGPLGFGIINIGEPLQFRGHLRQAVEFLLGQFATAGGRRKCGVCLRYTTRSRSVRKKSPPLNSRGKPVALASA